MQALGRLRDVLVSTRYTLRTPSAERATADAAATLAQLDDYLLPRLSRLDAPLLVGVGGSTGAGKSTLVNSLVRAPVSTPGVLRPTTRAPVLVCNPTDSSWFSANQLLPGLTRTASPSNDPESMQVVTAPGMTPGLAFLDAPDIDSVVEANRALAGQLLAAADLWLFVTTAARYADAVPWGLLRTARERGTVVALVLDRVPPGAADEIGPHLMGMLREHGLASAPLFVLPETSLDGQGLLAERVVLPLRAWFDKLASSAAARSAVVRQTVGGAVDALQPTVGRLSAAAEDQVSAVQALDEAVRTAYREAYQAVEKGMRDGVLLRGEVLARWQELVGTGDLMRALQARIGHARDRVVAALTGRPAPGKQFQAALESGVVTLIRSAGADAAERTAAAWRAHPAGKELVTAELAFPSPELGERAERLVRDWQRGVLDLVREEAQGKLALAKASAYAVNATGLLVMVSVFAATAFIPTGAEVATAAGTTIAAQKVLEAIFGDQAVRSLAERARTDLLKRVRTALNAEADRFDAVRASTGVDLGSAQRLRDAAAAVATARRVTDLPAHATQELPRLALNGATRPPTEEPT
ncbi:ABC transporter [Virgisporangium aliadipatigenens]|nr:ABC transporter [Virgisporangium aliadipatigenens]